MCARVVTGQKEVSSPRRRPRRRRSVKHSALAVCSMFRWLTDLASPRSLEAALRVTNDDNTTDQLMTDLIISEIRASVKRRLHKAPVTRTP
uniref:Uncharacterized protein n=1 Tax=Plectus sambesii TaxID=2011161 RepID=A0A914XRC7_9BILA